MEEIQQKIELILFNYIVTEDAIINDEGEHNVPLEYDNNVRYTYEDSNDYGERSLVEQKRIKFLNEVMALLSDVHLYVYQNDPLNKPIYFLPEKLEEMKKKEFNRIVENDAPPDGTEDCDVDILNDDIEAMSI